MNTARLFTLFVLCFLLTGTTNAQTQFTGGAGTVNTIKTSPKTSIHLDVQFRSTDEIKQLQTALFRTGLNYHLNKNVILTAGYAYIRNKKAVGGQFGYTPEHRLWEQAIVNHKLKPVLVSHRFRLEQRFISRSVIGGDPIEDGPRYANRFRYFIRNMLPLKKQETFTKGAFAALQNEVFLNFGDKSDVNGKTFDQNRLYIAGGYRLSAKADLELGYMNQYVNGRGSQFTNNHIIQLACYLRL